MNETLKAVSGVKVLNRVQSTDWQILDELKDQGWEKAGAGLGMIALESAIKAYRTHYPRAELLAAAGKDGWLYLFYKRKQQTYIIPYEVTTEEVE